MTSGTNFPNVEALAAVVARSQIVVALPRVEIRHLPPGFDDADIAILDWIVAESRRGGRSFLPM